MIIWSRKKGEALCPERYDNKTLEQIKKDVGTMVWAGLYQQRPAPQEGSIFKLQWFKYYKRLPYLNEIYQSWDTAE